MCTVLYMDNNTTRPVAVNAATRTARRSFADDGVRANGNTPPHTTHEGTHPWDTTTEERTPQTSGTPTAR